MSTALAWITIVRFGVVQACVAAVTVLCISTLPRLMVEELSLLALAPGVLIGIHYAVQATRLRFGYGSDVGGRRTPWIVGGLLFLGLAGVAAALSVSLLAENRALGYAAAVLSYAAVGIGVGAAGTTLLALLATTVAPERRAPAATIVWLLMIVGLVLTAKLAGDALIPFTYARLVEVSVTVSAIAFAVGCLALWGIERPAPVRPERADEPRVNLRTAFGQIWSEPAARGFTVFVFISMFAYNMQELVLEPYSASAFSLSPGESTKLSGDHHTGVLVGLILIAIVGRLLRGRPQALVAVTVAGCLGSALSVGLLATSAFFAPEWPLRVTVTFFGLANGIFAGAAIASMFSLAGVGRERREGTRMGIWGAAQAFGFGLGMFSGALALDLFRSALPETTAYAAVFFAEAALFILAAGVALRLSRRTPQSFAAHHAPSPQPA